MKKRNTLMLVLVALLLGTSCSKVDTYEDRVVGIWELDKVEKVKPFFCTETFETILTDFRFVVNADFSCKLLQDNDSIYNSGTWYVYEETEPTGVYDDDLGGMQYETVYYLEIDWDQQMEILQSSRISKASSKELKLSESTNFGTLIYEYEK